MPQADSADVRCKGRLPPAAYLFWKQNSFASVAIQLHGHELSVLDYHHELSPVAQPSGFSSDVGTISPGIRDCIIVISRTDISFHSFQTSANALHFMQAFTILLIFSITCIP